MSKNVANLPYSNGPVRGSIKSQLKSFRDSNSKSNVEINKELNEKNMNLGLFFQGNSKIEPLLSTGTNLVKNASILSKKRTKSLNKSMDLTNRLKPFNNRNESSSLFNKISLQDSFREPKSQIGDITKFLDTTMSSLNKRIEEKKKTSERICFLKLRANELQSLICNITNQLHLNEKYLYKLKTNAQRFETDCDYIRETISLLTTKADEKTKIFEEEALKLKSEYDISFQDLEMLKDNLKQESQESLKEKSRLKQSIRKLEINHLEANNAIDSSRKKQMEIKREKNEALEIIKQKSLLISKMFNDSISLANIKTVKQVTPIKIKSKRNYSINESSKTNYK